MPPQQTSTLKGLAHNRAAQLAVGGAALLGLVVLMRRGGSSSTSTGTGISTSPTGAGTLDTTSADIANQLGQFGAAQQQNLMGFQQQLTSTLQQLQQLTPAPTPSPVATPVPSPAPAPPPNVAPPSPPKPVYVSLPGGTLVSDIISKYGISTLTAFRNMNPDLQVKYPNGRVRQGQDITKTSRLLRNSVVEVNWQGG